MGCGLLTWKQSCQVLWFHCETRGIASSQEGRRSVGEGRSGLRSNCLQTVWCFRKWQSTVRQFLRKAHNLGKKIAISNEGNLPETGFTQALPGTRVGTYLQGQDSKGKWKIDFILFFFNSFYPIIWFFNHLRWCKSAPRLFCFLNCNNPLWVTDGLIWNNPWGKINKTHGQSYLETSSHFVRLKAWLQSQLSRTVTPVHLHLTLCPSTPQSPAGQCLPGGKARGHLTSIAKHLPARLQAAQKQLGSINSNNGLQKSWFLKFYFLLLNKNLFVWFEGTFSFGSFHVLKFSLILW